MRQDVEVFDLSHHLAHKARTHRPSVAELDDVTIGYDLTGDLGSVVDHCFDFLLSEGSPTCYSSAEVSELYPTSGSSSGLEDFALFLLVLRLTWVDDMSFKEIESDRIRCLIHDDNILDI